MADLEVNTEILISLGMELCRIGAAFEDTDTWLPFAVGAEDLSGTATAAVSATAGDQVHAAFRSVASRINAMGGAAIRSSRNYEAADEAFAGLLDSNTGGVYR